MRKQCTYRWFGFAMPFTYLFIPALLAQAPDLAWDATLGGTIWEELNTMVALPNGGYLVGGYTSSSANGDITQPSNGSGDYWIVQLTPEGEKVWDKNYGGSGIDRLWSIQLTPDGGYLLGGSSDSPASGDKTEALRGETDLWIVRLDAAGTLLWEKSLGGTNSEDLVAGVLPTADGGFLLAGHSNSDSGFEKTEASRGGFDFWIVKLDANGNLLWDKTYGGAEDDKAFALAQAPDGFLIGGLSHSGISGDKTDVSRGITDYWLLKLDQDGNLLWDKTYGGAGIETLVTIHPVSDGGFLLGGQSSSDISWEKSEWSYGHLDYWLVKINAQGHMEWDRTFGGLELDVLHAIQETPTGDFVLGGVSASSETGNHTSTSQGAYDYWIISTNESGTKRWEKSIGGTGDDAMTCIIPAADGGFLIGGHSNSNTSGDKTQDSKGMNDIWLVKTACSASLELGADFSVCRGSEISLDAGLIDCESCIFEWDDGHALPYRVASIYEKTSFQLEIKHPDNCILLDSITVDVSGGIQAANFILETTACEGEGTGTIALEDLDGGVAPFYLYMDGAIQPEGLVEDLISGTYQFTVKDAAGCELDTVFNLSFSEELTLELGDDQHMPQGSSVQLEGRSNQEELRIVWDQLEWLSCSDCLDPIASPEETTTFHLTIYNDAGCVATDELTVFVTTEGQVYIPNAFSPNADGANDEFMIYHGAGIQGVKMLRVFDKWGGLLFESAEGVWDGQSGGKPMPVGVYAYFAVVELANGKEQLYQGDLMLMR